METAVKHSTTKQKAKTLSNGLSPEQVEKAKSILSQVKQTEVAAMAGVKISTINNVLRGKSPNVGDLKKMLTAANVVIKNRQKTIKALPL